MAKEIQANQAEDNMEDLEPKQSKGKKVLNTIINIVLVFAIIVAAFATYSSFVSTSGNGVPSIFGIRIMSIQTESMYPTLNPGDLIFDVPVSNTSDLRVGDVITYWTVIDGQRVLNTHRIYEIYDGGGYYIFETKGDNNTVSDSLTVHESEIVGKWDGAKVGGLGKVFDYLQTSTGFLIVVVVPVALFFIFHLIQFFRVLFEYQNIKNKLQYELERGKAEEFVEEEKRKLDDIKQKERARLEAELREKLRGEILAANSPQSAKPESAPEPEKAEEAPKPAEDDGRAAIEAQIRANMEAQIRAMVEKEFKERAAQTAQDTAEQK
ncbi:MAG: signal peptidase I [Oscillospiraceae bacterium]|nr:signal peptidase I [Oscillospiraceae bacterium]